MKTGRTVLIRALALGVVLTLAPTPTDAADPDPWEGYLEYAYVYSSADAASLAARLVEYGEQAGISLEKYAAARFESGFGARRDERDHRHEAIAYLLLYLADGDVDHLERSVDAAHALENSLGRHENRYWAHYVLAHEALEKRDSEAFVQQILDLWLRVVSPLETPYETLRILSLSQAPSAGFAAALPYVYENIARMILIRSQEKWLDRGLDSLGAVVRMLHDGRVGAHPDIIPREASSWAYLDRIVRRLRGAESDGGSLTFTLALFEARKAHDRARTLLGSEGLEPGTWQALNVATGAYEAAIERAETVQGHCAVFTRALRQLGEVYAARQRFGVDRELETPFTIAKAMQVYRAMYEARDRDWEELGFRGISHEEYLAAMWRLWEEIQESSLNAAAFHLARSVEHPHRAAELVRIAARTYARYLDFFHRFASYDAREAVPPSAYFAAYDSARGYGDAFLAYPGAAPSKTEVELAVQRYHQAIRLFPFDNELWPAYRGALDREGRGNEYLSRVQSVADGVARSRRLDSWIERNRRGAQRIRTMRRAISDGLALMYLGYADGSGADELQSSLEELREKRAEAARLVADLARERSVLLGGGFEGAAPPANAAGGPAKPDDGGTPSRSLLAASKLEAVERRLAAASFALARIDKQVEARTRALPLYRATLADDALMRELAVERDHPVHELLRQVYHENES
ncbi:MAG: hypothetical protein V3V67_05610 [Myxococcota bacterium]